jgi:hypothetical protein
MLIEK